MQSHLMPKTSLGKWSTRLIIALIILFISRKVIMVSLQISGGSTFFSSPVLAMLLLGAAAAGIISFFAGLLAIIRKKERSILVFLSTFIGFFVLCFSLAEIMFPH